MLDYFLILITVIVMIQLYLKKGLQNILFWLFLDVILVIVHIFKDTVRWQVVPMYGLIIGVLLYYLILQIELKHIRLFLSRLLLVLLTMFMLVSIFTTLAFTIPTLTAPEGVYRVGTLALNIDREENEENRDLRLQIWYPTDEVGDYVPWMMDGAKATEALAELYHLPAFITGHLNEVYTHSSKEVSVSPVEEKYPVIVLSHGWASFRNTHLYLAERLASEGYIVIAIDHTYACLMTRLSDGSIATLDQDHINEDTVLEDGEKLIGIFSRDTEAVIDFLPTLNEEHKLLHGSMDFDNLGLLGHSTGAAGQVLYAQNHSIHAVFSMDPWLEPIEVSALEVPIDVFRSTEWQNSPNDEHLRNLVSKVYQIDNTKHTDFTMFSIMAPFFKWINKTSGDYSDVLEAYIVKFFDRNLKNIIRDPILDNTVKTLDI